MVSNRCKMAVKDALNKLDLHFVMVDLGEVDIMENISQDQLYQLKILLQATGLELMDDKKTILIERIKAAILYMIQHLEELPETNFSDYISKALNLDYNTISTFFSEIQGSTIQQFLIIHKIERVKELIIHHKESLTDISFKLQYSSVAHLSNQFKKVTGLTPTQFMKLREKSNSNSQQIEIEN